MSRQKKVGSKKPDITLRVIILLATISVVGAVCYSGNSAEQHAAKPADFSSRAEGTSSAAALQPTENPNISHSKVVYTDHVVERRGAMEKLISDAEKVARLSHSAQASAYAAQLRRGAALTAPIIDPTGLNRQVSQVISTPAKGVRPIPVVVIMDGDELKSPAWGEWLRDNLIASFVASTNSLITRASILNSCSPLYAGIIIQHEMFHLNSAESRGGRSVERGMEHLEDERLAYTYEFELLDKIGGQPWKQALRREVAWLKRMSKKDAGVYTYPDSQPYKMYASELNQVFSSEPTYGLEDKMRMTELYVAGLFTFLQETEGKQANMYQIQILSHMYKD